MLTLPKHCHHLKKKSHIPNSPSPQPRATTNLLSVPIDLSSVNISYKQDHIICSLLYVASFTQNNVFKVHPCYTSVLHFFLWLKYIPLYEWATFGLSLHPFMHTWFFPFAGHCEECCYAMNIYIEVHTWTYGLNSLKCIPRSGTAGSNDVCPWHSWTTNPVLCRDFPSMPHWYYPLLLTSSGHWKVSCDSFIPLSVVWPFSLAAFRIILIFNVQACVSRHGLIFISMWDLFFFLNPLNVISFLLAPLPPSGIPDIC